MNDEEADEVVRVAVQRLKERREELRMSVNKLAEKAGMSHVGVLQIESGERSPMLRNVIKIAAALEIGLDELLSEAN